ncbi:lysyl oxidase family protein [Actinokineospora sp.]|uniref:lysyl oxidase family protein n=1 Tax=Actinokineospora sp. TaxID=1872133 RepID=UPI003D6A7B36
MSTALSRPARSPRLLAGTGLVLSALVAVSSRPGLPSRAAAATAALPDLVADPPGNSAAPQVYTDSTGSQLLLRFDGYVHNQGTGALEMRGSNRVGDAMSVVRQRIYDTAGGYVDTPHTPSPVITFESGDGHNHWHLRGAAAYSLWNSDRTAQVGAAQKVGFCLVDTEHMDPFGPVDKAYTSASTGFCERGLPGADSIHMGISAGWRDLYSRFLAFQWVDISDVSPGRYRLRSTVDPDGVVVEANEVNTPAYAAAESVVNGYVATPFSKRVGMLFGSTIALQSTMFDDPWPGSPGTRQYRIEQAPQVGTLSKRPSDGWFTASNVTYTPRFGYSGKDSFRYSVRDSTSPFPRTPVPATVSIGVGVEPAPTVVRQPSAGPTPARTEAAPDVSRAAPAANGEALGHPVVERSGPWVLVSAVAGRAGQVRMSLGALGDCATQAPAGATVTCRFDSAHNHGDHHSPAVDPLLRAAVTLTDTLGRATTRVTG